MQWEKLKKLVKSGKIEKSTKKKSFLAEKKEKKGKLVPSEIYKRQKLTRLG